MLRPEFIRRKLHLIAEDLGRLKEFEEISFEELVDDFIRLAAVERILERIVTRAIDINHHIIAESATGKEERITRFTYRDTFLKLAELNILPPDFAEKISGSAGLRNLLVHDYNEVDRKILYESIGTCLKDYITYIEHVEQFLGRGE